MSSRPNILWICTDQQRFDTLSALGNPYAQTPHLDKFVTEGTTFNNAFCQSPVCAKSGIFFDWPVSTNHTMPTEWSVHPAGRSIGVFL